MTVDKMDNWRVSLFAVLVVFVPVVVNQIEDNLTCLSCDSVPLPGLCRHIDRCGPHEVCLTEAFVTAIGTIKYSQRCTDKQFCHPRVSAIGKRSGEMVCSECCNTTLCNSGLCGRSEFSKDNGPVCYSCEMQIGTTSCEAIELCGRQEACHIAPVEMHGAPPDLFKTSCINKLHCQSQTQPGMCSSCCESNLCNTDLQKHCNTSTVATTTHTAEQTTTVSATTHSDQSTSSTQASTTHATASNTTSGTENTVCQDMIYCLSDSVCKAHGNSSVYYCPKTCHYCKGAVATSNITDYPLCYDISSGCNSLCGRHGNGYEVWLEINCRSTCGHCYHDSKHGQL